MKAMEVGQLSAFIILVFISSGKSFFFFFFFFDFETNSIVQALNMLTVSSADE